MAYQASIIQIDTETVLAECGPMRLTIQARRGNKPLIDLATRSGYEALDYLDRIAGVDDRQLMPCGVKGDEEITCPVVRYRIPGCIDSPVQPGITIDARDMFRGFNEHVHIAL